MKTPRNPASFDEIDRKLRAIEPHWSNIIARMEVVAEALDYFEAPEFSKTIRGAEQLYHNNSVHIQNLEADLTFKPFDHWCIPLDDALVLARTDDGRMMIWKWSLLKSAMDSKTPDHLQFPATGWISLQSLRVPK